MSPVYIEEVPFELLLFSPGNEKQLPGEGGGRKQGCWHFEKVEAVKHLFEGG